MIYRFKIATETCGLKLFVSELLILKDELLGHGLSQVNDFAPRKNKTKNLELGNSKSNLPPGHGLSKVHDLSCLEFLIQIHLNLNYS